MPEVAEHQPDSVVRRRVIRNQPAYTPPPNTAYPPDANLDMILTGLEDITEGDGAITRSAELAQGIWELQGILLRRRFGNPAVIGSCPEPDPALVTRLHRIERLLASVRRRVSDTFAISAPVARNGAEARGDADAMIIVLDCGARVTRSLRDACIQSRSLGSADAVN